MTLPVFGSSNAIADGDFLTSGLGTSTSTEIQITACETTNIMMLMVIVNTAGVGTGNITYTLRVDGVDTSFALAVSATATGLQTLDVTPDQWLNEGSLLSVRADHSGTVTTPHSNVIVRIV